MERRCVVVRHFGDKCFEYTKDRIASYASKCDADLHIIDTFKINIGSPHNEIFQAYDLLKDYERILFVDSDVIIKNEAPDLFDLVPTDKIGTVLEDTLSRKCDRHKRMSDIQNKYGQIGWNEGYVNSGVFLVSDCHREIFNLKKFPPYCGSGYDDVYLSYRIKEGGYGLFDLPKTFNHMSLFSEFGSNWLQSYFIHYAGRGFYPKLQKEEQIVVDLAKLSLPKIPLNLLPRLFVILRGLSIFIRSRRKCFYNVPR